MKKQDSQQRVGIGVSSVLMILVVLAMTALSLLAFGSARSNESMTRRNADVGASYYVAADQVQRKLAQIDELLLKARQESADLAWFLSQPTEDVAWEESEKGISFSFTTDAGNDLAIFVRGIVTDGQQRYQLAEHRIIDNSSAMGDDYLVLMGD